MAVERGGQNIHQQGSTRTAVQREQLSVPQPPAVKATEIEETRKSRARAAETMNPSPPAVNPSPPAVRATVDLTKRDFEPAPSTPPLPHGRPEVRPSKEFAAAFERLQHRSSRLRGDLHEYHNRTGEFYSERHGPETKRRLTTLVALADDEATHQLGESNDLKRVTALSKEVQRYSRKVRGEGAEIVAARERMEARRERIAQVHVRHSRVAAAHGVGLHPTIPRPEARIAEMPYVPVPRHQDTKIVIPELKTVPASTPQASSPVKSVLDGAVGKPSKIPLVQALIKALSRW